MKYWVDEDKTTSVNGVILYNKNTFFTLLDLRCLFMILRVSSCFCAAVYLGRPSGCNPQWWSRWWSQWASASRANRMRLCHQQWVSCMRCSIEYLKKSKQGKSFMVPSTDWRDLFEGSETSIKSYLLLGSHSERHIDWRNWNRSGKIRSIGERETD